MWWHKVTHGRGSEGEPGEWSGLPVPFTLPRNMVYPAILPLMRTPRLPVVDWTDAPADLNGLVRFAERRNMISARVPSHFKSGLPHRTPFFRPLRVPRREQSQPPPPLPLFILVPCNCKVLYNCNWRDKWEVNYCLSLKCAASVTVYLPQK